MKHFYLLFVLFAFNLNAQVTPLLSTTWNQTCYYNEQMPIVGSGGSCGKAFTGCNATAMAQICKYYSYPISGFGSHCNTNSPTHCADYASASYNYVAMPNNVTSSNSNVATLIHDLGVAVDMTWNGTNSTSFFSTSVLKEYFAYSPKMYATATFIFPTTADLIAAIKIELDNGRPVYAKGGGHFYLIDGYDLANKFHMNFGWGGTYDGYYNINSVVTPAGTFTPSNFIFNIMPLQGQLETAKDTIFIGASGVSSENLEFTSILDWTATTSSSWITLNLPAGSKGYMNHSNGSHFSATVNNGAARIGYIIIENASTTDTIVVVQSTPTMQVNPDFLNFTFGGGVQTVNVSHESWANWNINSTETWLSLSAPNGTGNGTINVTASSNISGASRFGYVIVTSGVFTDSIYVTQEADLSAGIEIIKAKELSIYPNPFNDVVTVSNLGSNETPKVFDLLGKSQNITGTRNGNQYTLNFNDLRSGIYLIEISGKTHRVMKK